MIPDELNADSIKCPACGHKGLFEYAEITYSSQEDDEPTFTPFLLCEGCGLKYSYEDCTAAEFSENSEECYRTLIEKVAGSEH